MSPPAGRPAQQVHLPGIDAPRFLPPDVLGATVGPAETRGGASDGDLYLLGRRARLGDALHELGSLALGGVGECAGVVADGRAFHHLSATWMARASRLALSDTAASVAPVPPLAISKVTVRRPSRRRTRVALSNSTLWTAGSPASSATMSPTIASSIIAASVDCVCASLRLQRAMGFFRVVGNQFRVFGRKRTGNHRGLRPVTSRKGRTLR